MPTSLDKIQILPKMQSEKYLHREYQLIWVLDLVSESTICFVSLLFRDIDSGYYLIDMVPPELLTYCTIGSFFKNGKKIDRASIGDELKFTIDISEESIFVETSESFSDSEYDLSLCIPEYSGDFTNKFSNICKRQQCAVFQDGEVKVIIPWFVIGGVYYFRSTKIREAILSLKINSLYEEYEYFPDTNHVSILIRPEVNDRDGKYIARFLIDKHAQKCLNLLGRRKYVSKEYDYQNFKVDFPVKQILNMRARGKLTTNIDGGQTFIVFQILEEDSNFPFDSLEIVHHTNEPAPEGSDTFPVKTSKTGRRMTTNNPSGLYIHRALHNYVEIINPHETAIKETKIYISDRPSDGKTPAPKPGEKNVILSAQIELSSVDDAIAKSNVSTDDKNTNNSYEMPLDSFIIMVNRLIFYKHPTTDGLFKEIGDFFLSRYFVWKKERSTDSWLSLKESYDWSVYNRRECAYITFNYDEKYICLVEIDQRGLPSNGCSTYVLIAKKKIDVGCMESIVKAYIMGEQLARLAKKLFSEGIIFEKKHHPESSSEDDQNRWISRLIKIIEKY